MAKKITLQHWYTTGSTTAPTGLIEGEIAISHTTGNEAIFLKNDIDNNEVKFIPKTQIESLISAATSGLASDANISLLTTDLTSHKNLKGRDNKNLAPTYGHVALVSGDISGVTNYVEGVAASSYHTHGQYIAKDDISNGLETYTNDAKEMLRVKAAADGGIIVDDNGVSINSGLTKMWSDAADAINAFMNDNAISGAVDTLKEINEYLTGTGTSVETLLKTLDDLTDTVTGNTVDINTLSGTVSGNRGEIINLKKNKVDKVKDESGDNIKVNYGTTLGVNEYIIVHTSASTQNSAITATNDPTGLSFGSEFKIVDNIGYDKNGHVVSGSTQTLKLPSLLTGSTLNLGVVKLFVGNIPTPVDGTTPTPSAGLAASTSHWHDDYVKFTDLYSGNTSSNITISCGTY